MNTGHVSNYSIVNYNNIAHFGTETKLECNKLFSTSFKLKRALHTVCPYKSTQKKRKKIHVAYFKHIVGTIFSFIYTFLFSCNLELNLENKTSKQTS